MPTSPGGRSTRRTIQPFARTPSKLSKTTLSSSPDNDDAGPSTPIRSFTPSAKLRRVTQVSPAIHYSPYATSTPPSGLSRSSSVPFDLAGNAIAARKLEVERSKSPEVGATPKKRVIRKRPWSERLAGLPSEVVDNIIFHLPSSVSDILPEERFALPIAVLLHVGHYLLLAPLFKDNDRPDSVLKSGPPKTGVGSRWDEWERKDSAHGLAGRWTVSDKITPLVLKRQSLSLTALLTMLAVANAGFLFTRYRTYDMHLRSASCCQYGLTVADAQAEDSLRSPHASPVPAPLPNGDPLGAQEEISEPVPWNRLALEIISRILVMLAKSAWRVFTRSSLVTANSRQFFSSLIGRDASRPKEHGRPPEPQIQSLRVWNPPDFCLAFSCGYPPSAPMIAYLLTHSHPFLAPILHVMVSFMLTHLARTFAQLVKDRTLLGAEVMKEYDQRFVYKRVFASRSDRGVQTDQGDWH